MNTEATPGHVASTEGLGVCVIVGGQVIAWFRYGDQAEKWATKHYFGRWLMRTPVAKPEPAPGPTAKLRRYEPWLMTCATSAKSRALLTPNAKITRAQRPEQEQAT